MHEEFYVITHKDRALRFGSYCVATEVSEFSKGTIYHNLSHVKRRLGQACYVGGKQIRRKALKVLKIHAEIEYAEPVHLDFKVKK